MNLGDRLKQARENLRFTQKEMAAALNTNPQTLRVYESNKSIPGGNVLEALARLGININWILTGEGEIRRDKRRVLASGADLTQLSKQIRMVRGDESLESFADCLDITREEAEHLENGIIEPGYGFLSYMCFEYDINPNWLFDDKEPMKGSEARKVITQLNKTVLKSAVIAASEAMKALEESNLSPPAELWIDMMASFYEYAANSPIDLKDSQIGKKSDPIRRMSEKMIDTLIKSGSRK